MRKLLYRLSNGTTVNTMTEAKASGLEYTVFLEKIPGKPPVLTEKQKANRKALH